MKCLLLLVHLLSSSGRRLQRQDEWEQQPLAEGEAHWDGAEPSGCGRDLLSSVLDNLPVEAVVTLVEKSMPPTRCSPDGCELGSDVASGIFATCQAVGGTINPVIGLACGLGDKVAKTHKKEGCSKCKGPCLGRSLGPTVHPVLHPVRHLFALLDDLDTSADKLELVQASTRLAGALDNYYFVRGQFNLIERRADGEVVRSPAVQEFVTLAEELGLADTSATIHRLVEDSHLELFSCQDTKKLLKVVMDSHMLAAIAVEISGRASKDMEEKDVFFQSFKRINSKYIKSCQDHSKY